MKIAPLDMHNFAGTTPPSRKSVCILQPKNVISTVILISTHVKRYNQHRLPIQKIDL